MAKFYTEIGYLPLETDNGWCWTHAISECPAYHYILPDHIWQRLSKYIYEDSYGSKYYGSKEQAMSALGNVLCSYWVYTK